MVSATREHGRRARSGAGGRDRGRARWRRSTVRSSVNSAIWVPNPAVTMRPTNTASAASWSSACAGPCARPMTRGIGRGGQVPHQRSFHGRAPTVGEASEGRAGRVVSCTSSHRRTRSGTSPTPRRTSSIHCHPRGSGWRRRRTKGPPDGDAHPSAPPKVGGHRVASVVPDGRVGEVERIEVYGMGVHGHVELGTSGRAGHSTVTVTCPSSLVCARVPASLAADCEAPPAGDEPSAADVDGEHPPATSAMATRQDGDGALRSHGRDTARVA